MKIRDFVKIDQYGEFISAVSLSDFDVPKRNTQLVRSFIFSDHTPDSAGLEQKYHGTIDLLDKFRKAFISNTNNTLMVLADFGHGKSHFALAAMNFFEKPKDSDEVKIIIDRIKQAIPENAPKAENFLTFKKARDRFLVLYLDGTSGKSIKEMLYAALIKGLSRHPDTKNVNLSLWNQLAIDWIKERKDQTEVKKFLAKTYKTDCINLIKDVEMNKDGAWERYVQLFKEFNSGSEPDGSGNKNPKEVINWVIQQFVGDEKPFSGLVIFFDEFSQFIQSSYSKKMDGTLMNLLQGVGENKQKALLIGFGQHDPVEIAKDLNNSSATADVILKELNRLEEKLYLYSLVESILDSYLANSNGSWEQLIEENPMAKSGFLGHISEFSWEIYQSHYERDLKWDNAKFRDVVVKGCYPLHPTTIGLLAHLKMVTEISDDSRTMLRFVQQVFDLKKDEEIMLGNRVNWVYPIDLVDHFKDKIANPVLYIEYVTANNNLRTILAENVTEDQNKMLKALLIQYADQQFGYNKYKQIELLSHYCGLAPAEGSAVLKILLDYNIIKYIDYPGAYSFWPTGINPQALYDEIKKRLADQKFDLSYLLKMETRLNKQTDIYKEFRPFELSIEWGHPSEWAADQTIFTRERFTPENIRKLIPAFQFSPSGIKQPTKGMVVWCLALYDEDVDYFKQKSADILEAAFSGYISPPPILVVLPGENNSSLTNLYMKYEILMDISLSEQNKKDLGTDQINSEILKTKKDLQQKLLQYFSNPLRQNSIGESFVFPKIYFSSLKDLSLRINPIQKIMEALYRSSYTIRPNSFFTDIKGYGKTKVTSASKKVSAMLAKNNLGTFLQVNPPSAIEKRLIDDYLLKRWKILSPAYFVIEPEDFELKKAWDYLSENIKSDKKEIKLKVLIEKLLSSPYGFDFNTAMLFFSAWVGCHNKELKFFRSNRETTVKDVFDSISSNTDSTAQIMFDMFFAETLAVSREDSSAVETEVKIILENIQANKSITQADGETFLVKLQDFLDKEEGSGHPLENDCRNAIDFLKINLDEVQEYNKAVDSIQDDIGTQTDINALKKIQARIQKLVKPHPIETTRPDLADLQQTLDEKIGNVVENICSEPNKLKNIEDVGIIRNRITETIKQLSGSAHLTSKLKDALADLENKTEQLRGKEDEKAILATLDLIAEKAPLRKLQENLTFIKELDYLPVCKEKIKSKAERIAQEISELEKFANLAFAEFQSINENNLQTFREKVLTRANLYEGSAYQAKFETIRTYIGQLEKYFSEMRPYSKLDDSNLYLVEKSIKEISDIAAKYGGEISDDHLSNLRSLENKLKNAHQKLFGSFEKQLVDIESVLKTELGEVSGTLNIAEFRKKIDTVRLLHLDIFKNRIEKALNDLKKIENEMNERYAIEQIETLFKTLDSNKKSECLQKLKNL